MIRPLKRSGLDKDGDYSAQHNQCDKITCTYISFKVYALITLNRLLEITCDGNI